MALPKLTPAVSPTPGSAGAAAAPLPALVASGQFNLYAREQFRTSKLTFGRHDYYKISLVTGSSRHQGRAH